MEDFRQKRLTSKEISFHAPKNLNQKPKSFHHAIPKIRITKKRLMCQSCRIGTF